MGIEASALCRDMMDFQACQVVNAWPEKASDPGLTQSGEISLLTHLELWIRPLTPCSLSCPTLLERLVREIWHFFRLARHGTKDKETCSLAFSFMPERFLLLGHGSGVGPSLPSPRTSCCQGSKEQRDECSEIS